MCTPAAPASMNILINFIKEVIPPNPQSPSAIIGVK